ncbi:MAG: MerR family transcriptional regulator [Acidimicrobiaceae bacterium]|nr:MerR family transcriptional regulator [Acidimicrobiaceae bacterium]
MNLPFDDEHCALYSVGQVAEMLNVQPAFLRRLDGEEVVQPSRSDGGQRRYSQNQIYKVQRVIGLASEGLTLAGIRRLLALEAEVRDLKTQVETLKRRNRYGEQSAV